MRNSLDADIAVIWSMLWSGKMSKNHQIYQHYRSQGRDVIVLEVGALNRGHLWRIGKNHVNGRGYFGPCDNDETRAQNINLRLKPWKENGEHVLISLQRYDSGQWQSKRDAESWLSNTIKLIQQHTNRPIYLRPHPRYKDVQHFPNVWIQQPQRLLDTYDDYDFVNSLENTWAVINWSSNPGIQSVIHGVPVFTGPDSLAAPVANLDFARIESPHRPDRQQWLNDLAYCEWTLEEISQGLPLDRLMPIEGHQTLV